MYDYEFKNLLNNLLNKRYNYLLIYYNHKIANLLKFTFNLNISDSKII
jgi:hypothetical protein